MKKEKELNEEENINYLKAKIFYCKGKKVHVSKKGKNGLTIIYNGLLSEVSNEFILINDIEEGERLVLFSELAKDLEEFKEK